MAFSAEYVNYMQRGRDLGHGTWADKRRRYWKSWWTRKRCLVCCRRNVPLQLHHLTYRRLGREWLLDLRPLCAPCHSVVTFVSRALRPSFSVRQSTYLVWLAARLVVLLPVATVIWQLS